MNRIVIIGTGYVGLVTGVGMAEFGNKVICSDIDKKKIDKLNSGSIPIYEPGLDEIIKRNVKNQRLTFSSNVKESILKSDVIVIAVGTPEGKNGQADMSFVFSENLILFFLIKDLFTQLEESTILFPLKSKSLSGLIESISF